jgi:alpha-glucosidase
MKKTIELRYRMLPHLYTVLRQMYETGLPPMRPIFLEFPGDAESWSNVDEYMFGSSILTAPVVQEGAATKEVYLPPSAWFDFKTDKIYKGPVSIEYPAPLDTLPIFIREGNILAMGPVIQYTGQMKRNQIEFHVFPGAKKAAYELYEDDGATNGYLRGEYSITKVTADPMGKSMKINVPRTKGKYTGFIDKRNWTFIVHGDNSKAKAVKLNGKSLTKKGAATSKGPAWSIDKTTGNLTVTIPSSPSGFVIEITGNR